MNILMLRHSAGFEHSYLPDAEVALKQIGAANGWNVTTTHRCDRINADNLENRTLSRSQRRAICRLMTRKKRRYCVSYAMEKRFLVSITRQIRATIGPIRRNARRLLRWTSVARGSERHR